MDGLTGKVALVTGAGSGIGKETAIAFAREGASVVAVDLNDSGSRPLLDAIEDTKGEGIFLTCDVSRSDQVAGVLDKTRSAFGRLDIAFNNAGIEGEQGPTTECSEKNWDRTVAVNLKGVWLCMKMEIPLMLENGSGRIINCSSVAGLMGLAGLPAYVASKHGVIGLTRAAAVEYAKQGIQVNAVCPGAIRTPMLERVLETDAEAEHQMAALHPMGRIGEPYEVTSAVLWLASKNASFVTGQAIATDGGWSIS